MALPAEPVHHRVVHASRIAARRGPRAGWAAAGAAVAGLGWLAIAATLGLLALTTPLVDRLVLGGRVGPSQAAVAAVAWAIALTAPAVFAILGLSRLLGAAEALSRGRRKAGPAHALGTRLGLDQTVVGPVRLPDGRRVPELVLGPHGVVVFEVLPPPAATRRHGDRWEVRLEDGRWIPLESPLDRATRDAERVRRWLADDDRDFVVKVYAAVIASDLSLPRSPTCSVVTVDQIPGFLASLPAQRTLSPSRRERLLEKVLGAS